MKIIKKHNIIILILIIGTLDLVLACHESYIHNNIYPKVVLQFIASGVIGVDAFKPDSLTIVLGMVIHYAITTMVTIFYFVINVFKQFRIKKKYVSGIIYGTLIWLVMNTVVIPLSNTPVLNRSTLEIATSIIIQIVAMGLPIALYYAKYSTIQIKKQYD